MQVTVILHFEKLMIFHLKESCEESCSFTSWSSIYHIYNILQTAGYDLS
ncbi:hypothetical protein CIPAW_07G171300 [Carya illinoinensis]|uniref:Uncharacterized protein n=1 Tax=Carya illinoinensis TaxID=32201 RepID=A0A8T1Q403_CARIL|nr:hypothetical protein CIPAW_07G171300 [Carya illinoinensis]